MSPRKKSIADLAAAITDEDGRLRHAPTSKAEWEAIADESDPPAPIDEAQPADGPTLTINQVVAMNLQRARKARGWSQEQLGDALMGLTNRKWSSASVSAAESSWKGGRVRRFDANELAAFSLIFDLPVAHFFLPPTDADYRHATFAVDVLDEVGIPTIGRHRLVGAVWDTNLPREFIGRLTEELQLLGIDWAPDSQSVQLHMDAETMPAFIEALKAAGVATRDGDL